MALVKNFNKYYIDENCYIHISKTSGTHHIAEHSHDFLEICYILKGRSTQFIDGKEYLVGEGDFLFINLGSSHAFHSSDTLHYIDIILKPEFINVGLRGTANAFSLLELDSFKEFSKTVNRNQKLFHFSRSERRQIENLIFLALDEQKNNYSGKELMLRSLFNSLLTLVFRKMALPMKKEIGLDTDLLSYIKDNCAEPITLEEIATMSHYNPTYFSRLFKKHVGMNFTEYLTSCRIDLAAQLLYETELPINDIYVQSGFSDRTKFFKAFAKKMGTTPLKYRKSKN